jgi:hypothetical protein
VNNNQKGCYAEYLFATTAIQKGFNVSMPLLDKSKYDCVVEKDGDLFKFQIKFMGKDRYKHDGVMQINLKRVGNRSYSLSDVDFFAIWHEEYNGFFIIPNHGQHSIKLNIKGKYKENFNNFAIIHR